MAELYKHGSHMPIEGKRPRTDNGKTRMSQNTKLFLKKIGARNPVDVPSYDAAVTKKVMVEFSSGFNVALAAEDNLFLAYTIFKNIYPQVTSATSDNGVDVVRIPLVTVKASSADLNCLTTLVRVIHEVDYSAMQRIMYLEDRRSVGEGRSVVGRVGWGGGRGKGAKKNMQQA